LAEFLGRVKLGLS